MTISVIVLVVLVAALAAWLYVEQERRKQLMQGIEGRLQELKKLQQLNQSRWERFLHFYSWWLCEHNNREDKVESDRLAEFLKTIYDLMPQYIRMEPVQRELHATQAVHGVEGLIALSQQAVTKKDHLLAERLRGLVVRMPAREQAKLPPALHQAILELTGQ